MLAASARAARRLGAHEILPPPAGLREVTICALSGDARQRLVSVAREGVGRRRRHEALPCAWHHQSDEGLLTIYPPEYPRVGRSGACVGRCRRRTEGSGPASFGAEGAPAPSATPRRAEMRRSPSPIRPPARSTASIRRCAASSRRCRCAPSATRPTTLTWLVDGAPVGTASSERTVSWPLAVGRTKSRRGTPTAARASVRRRQVRSAGLYALTIRLTMPQWFRSTSRVADRPADRGERAGRVCLLHFGADGPAVDQMFERWYPGEPRDRRALPGVARRAVALLRRRGRPRSTRSRSS